MNEYKALQTNSGEEFLSNYVNRHRKEMASARPSRKKENAALLLALVLGFFFLAYPSAADYWNNFQQAKAVRSYAAQVADMSGEEYARMIHAAEEYNKRLSRKGIVWKTTEEEEKEYLSLLNIGNSGIMGYIDIPKINITLPIYHGIEDSILQVAIGHLEGTSLPVGGKGSHCVVSGHRGLPSARLFTDIDKLVEGDTWTMTVLGRTVTYETDQIRVVEPTDLSNLQIEKGKDYCTLVTCTPYGVNTHRLLVRGHRVANAQGEADVVADALLIESSYIIPFISVPVLLVLFIIAMASSGRQAKAKGMWKRVKKEFDERYHSDEGYK